MTIQKVREILPKDVWTISLDLQEACYHIPIRPCYRKFLGFCLGTKMYCFKALPFGLNIAPCVFTRLTNVVVTRLRAMCVWAVAYLDDWLIWASTPEECSHVGEVAQGLLKTMGFWVNIQKSRLLPAQQFEWLGVDWDTQSIQLSIPVIK